MRCRVRCSRRLPRSGRRGEVQRRAGAGLDLCDWLRARARHRARPERRNAVVRNTTIRRACSVCWPMRPMLRSPAFMRTWRSSTRSGGSWRASRACRATAHCACWRRRAYLDASRRAVYELQQPAFDAQAGAAPPYHRLLLGARVMHEWGHLARAAKWLRVPEDRRCRVPDGACRTRETFARLLARRARRRDRRDPRRARRHRAARGGATRGAGTQDAGPRRRLPGEHDVGAPHPRRGDAGLRAHQRAPSPRRAARHRQRTGALRVRDPPATALAGCRAATSTRRRVSRTTMSRPASCRSTTPRRCSTPPAAYWRATPSS